MRYQKGKIAALRGIIERKVWEAQPVRCVIKDSEDEVVLYLAPGSTCYYSEGLFRRKREESVSESRWDEAKRGSWKLVSAEWGGNHALIILEENKWYGIYHFWDDKFEFQGGYYVNFQLPFIRSVHGFDTLDLDLDIVVSKDLSWKYKDESDYDELISSGFFPMKIRDGIEQAKGEVVERIQKAQYPFDGFWIDWRPNADWTIPQLQKGWND